MNTPDMLTPEERELARLLGRPGTGTATPSAQLDARIMDLARAKPQTQPEQTQTDTQTRQRTTASASQRRGWGRRRGLVSSLAVAASLVLVVGLAWQLRPLTPPQPAMQHAEMSAPAAAPMAADIAAAEVAAAPASPAPTQVAEDAAAAPAVPQARSVVNAKAPSAGAAQPAAAHKDKASAIQQPATSNAGQSPRAFSAAPIIVPPAPPPPPAPVMAPAPMAAPARAEQQASSADGAQDGFYLSETAPTLARAASPRPAPTGSTPIPHAGAKTVSKAAEARRQRAEAIAADSTPDIEADATLSRHQWIKRIRERHEAGDLDGAKASLRRFAHDYPEARIPRDLRPLLKD